MSEFKSFELFQKFCILCGCDYYKHKGVGIERAKKICQSAKTYNMWEKKQDPNKINDLNKALDAFNLIK